MEDIMEKFEVNKTVEPEVEVKVEPEVEVPEAKEPTKNELLRELSKEHGVNLFDVEGLKAFKDYTESQKSDHDKLNEQLDGYKTKETEWQMEKLEYESKLKASELGIHANYMDDALKLADGDPSKLEEVIKKYPNFKTKDGIKIGVQSPNDSSAPTGSSEAEAYMASNPRVYKK
jgi:hypothetical protein